MAIWKIERRKPACAEPSCERPFEDGDRHISCLLLREGEFLREDLCLTCWRAKHGDEEPDQQAEGGDELFWWRTRHEEQKKRTVQLDLASLEQLFVQLEGREERKVRELRYVLCLLLMRKRRVKVEKIQRGAEGESFIVKRPRRDERFQVFVFDFDAEQMDAVRTQLQAVFDGAETDAGLPEQLLVEVDEGAEEDGELAAESSDGESEESEAGETETAESQASESEGAEEASSEDSPADEDSAEDEPAAEPEDSGSELDPKCVGEVEGLS